MKILGNRSFQFNLIAVFLVLVVGTIFIIIGYNYYGNYTSINKITDNLQTVIANNIIVKCKNHFKPAQNMTKIAADHIFGKVISFLDNIEDFEKFGLSVLTEYSQFSAFFFGDQKGNFFMLKRDQKGAILTKIILNSTFKPEVTWKYRDRNQNIIKINKINENNYDPRNRSWYEGALKNKSFYWSDVYIFFTDKKPGLTVAYPVMDEKNSVLGVFGIDITLESINEFLKKLKIGKSGFAYITNSKNEVIMNPIESNIVISKNTNKFRLLKIDELKSRKIFKANKALENNQINKIRFSDKDIDYLSCITEFPSDFLKQWKIGMIVPENDFLDEVRKNNRVLFIITAIISFLVIFTTYFFSKRICIPITKMTAEMLKIKDFDLSSNPNIKSSIEEIYLMNEALKSTKTGLLSFKKYVSAELVKQLITKGENAEIGGKRKNITVMFSHIHNFQNLLKTYHPEKIIIYLSEYLNELSSIIIDNKGTLDKYIGDGIMAFWGAPIDNEKHSYFACKAAVTCLEKVLELNEVWRKQGKPQFCTTIGINTGNIIVGNFGSDERMNYSVIGDGVNLAARLEGVNKMYGTGIIISQETYDYVKNDFITRPLDYIRVKGRKEAIKIYQIFVKEKLKKNIDYTNLSQKFSEGFEFYSNSEWNKAYNIFRILVNEYPDDIASKLYFKRCENYKENPPDKNWDKVFEMKIK